MISSINRSLTSFSSSSSSPEGYRFENDYGCSLDDAFSGNAVSPPGKSPEKPWKKVNDDEIKVSDTPEENHYEKMDEGKMAEQAEMTAPGEGTQEENDGFTGEIKELQLV